MDQQVFLDAVSRLGGVPTEEQLNSENPPVFLDVSIPIMRRSVETKHITTLFSNYIYRSWTLHAFDSAMSVF